MNRSLAAHAPQSAQFRECLIDLSVPCPTLTLVAQHAVVTMNGELYRCIDAEHALFFEDSNPVSWLFRCVMAPSKFGLCSLPTRVTNLSDQFGFPVKFLYP